MFNFKNTNKANNISLKSNSSKSAHCILGITIAGVLIASTFNIVLDVEAEGFKSNKNQIVKTSGASVESIVVPSVAMMNYNSPIEDAIETEVLQFVNIDYTQLKKTRLKEVIQELYDLMTAINGLGISQTEGGSQLYQELKENYDEAVYTLDNGLYKYPYTDEEYRLLARVIMNEQGANTSPDEAQMLVGCVVLNRMANGGINGDKINPSMLDILLEPGQYASHYTWNVKTDDITDKVWENTRRVLEHEYEAPANVMYQATFRQGSGIYKSFYNGSPYNNTTYFCYV